MHRRALAPTCSAEKAEACAVWVGAAVVAASASAAAVVYAVVSVAFAQAVLLDLVASCQVCKGQAFPAAAADHIAAAALVAVAADLFAGQACLDIRLAA